MNDDFIQKAEECKKNAMECLKDGQTILSFLRAASYFRQSGQYFNNAEKFVDAGEMYDEAALYYYKGQSEHRTHTAAVVSILAAEAFLKGKNELGRASKCYLSGILWYLEVKKMKKAAECEEQYADALVEHADEYDSLRILKEAIQFYESSYKKYKTSDHPAYAHICKKKAVKVIHRFRLLNKNS